jgi:hypothetical protein
MNYQLMFHGFLPVSIRKESRLDYFNVLEAYAINRDINLFSDMIRVLEEEQLDKFLVMKQVESES